MWFQSPRQAAGSGTASPGHPERSPSGHAPKSAFQSFSGVLHTCHRNSPHQSVWVPGLPSPAPSSRVASCQQLWVCGSLLKSHWSLCKHPLLFPQGCYPSQPSKVPGVATCLSLKRTLSALSEAEWPRACLPGWCPGPRQHLQTQAGIREGG